MAKALELTWVAKLRQWRKRRNVGGKRKDFYLGTGSGPDDRESYRRALAGIARGKPVFALPGSTGAVELAMTKLILPELGHLLAELRK